MKKTSVYLDPELDRALDALAVERGVSKAETIRAALREAVREVRQPRFEAVGIFEGPGDLAERLDDYLADTGFGE